MQSLKPPESLDFQRIVNNQPKLRVFSPVGSHMGNQPKVSPPKNTRRTQGVEIKNNASPQGNQKKKHQKLQSTQLHILPFRFFVETPQDTEHPKGVSFKKKSSQKR